MEKSIHTPKKWQPEHCPIGSRVIYATGFATEKQYVTVEVTGHVRNGIDSWVFETNAQCPIFPDNPEKHASANGDHIIAILERGGGGFSFNANAAAQRKEYQAEYLNRIAGAGSMTRFKGRHEYIAYDLNTLVMHAIYFNDRLFHQYTNTQHRYQFNESFFNGLLDLVKRDGNFGFVLTANKRKLVKRIKRLLPRARVTKKALLKEEAEWYRADYEREMELEYNDY